MRLWSTSRLNKPYHVRWRAAHSQYIVNSWGCHEIEESDCIRLGSYRDEFGDTKLERLLDSDWSSNFGIYGYSNSRNDGFWAKDREENYAKNFNFVTVDSMEVIIIFL